MIGAMNLVRQRTPFERFISLRVVFWMVLLLNVASRAQQFETVDLEGKKFTICRADPSRQRLHLFLRDEEGKAYNSFESLSNCLSSRGNKLLFAMNAGMYEADYSPVGLLVEDGKKLHGLALG